MEQYFYLDETPVMPGYYFIRVDHTKFGIGPTVGSYNLLQARLLNISYANYLRLCRDEFGAIISGKNTYYPVAYFGDKLLAHQLMRLLNARAAYVILVRDTPDHEFHKQEIARMQKEEQEIMRGSHATFPNPLR